EAEGLAAADADDPASASGQCHRQAARTDVHGSDAPAFLQRGDAAADPAVLAFAAWIGQLPDVHRLEVRVIGVGVADALHDGELPLLLQPVEVAHGGVQADLIVDADHLRLGEVQG